MLVTCAVHSLARDFPIGKSSVETARRTRFQIVAQVSASTVGDLQ